MKNKSPLFTKKKSLKQRLRWFFKRTPLWIILGLCGVIGFDFLVSINAKSKIYTKVTDVPFNEVAVVLGTSKRIKGGAKNLYYEWRLDAAAALYKANKVKFILLSGDNKETNYNEPKMMRADLISRGVPASVIYLDYAGFRTLDSMIRAKAVFGQTKFTVVSQQFHNQRAIFIAEHHDIDVVGYNAISPKVMSRLGLKVRVREVFSRSKMFLDLYILNKQPHFLGDPIVISTATPQPL